MNWVLAKPFTLKVLGKGGDVLVGHADQKTWATRQAAKAAEKRLSQQGQNYWAMREDDARNWDWDADLPF